MKRWWARIRTNGDDGYGRWVPTGCVDSAEAWAYMGAYLRLDVSLLRGRVQEWLAL